MINCKFYPAGHTAAMDHACGLLQCSGFTLLSRPDLNATHLLLPVPSFEPDGRIKGGGDLSELLTKLSKGITIFGGNLDRPELKDYTTVDFLQDPAYVAENANITAHCAIKLAMNKLSATLHRCPVLVIGWGRIGKCLARLLRQLGAEVTVAARKEADRAMLNALGYAAADTAGLDPSGYRVIFNTVPQMLLPKCDTNALKIDLASQLGIGGLDVVWARGLPNKDAPESSGDLIARTVARLVNRKEIE